MLGLTLFTLLALICGVLSHGNMKLPYNWYDKEMKGIKKNKVGCIQPEVPPTNETAIWPNVANWHNGNGKKFCHEGWFTNNTKIPGDRTISDEMLGPNGIKPRNKMKNPWFAPGTAPIFSPCGNFGGNPNGCRGGPPTEKYGDCCDHPYLVSHGTHCGGMAFGYNAETQPPEDAPVTLWELGSVQEVAWSVGANHEGGYSYRLCRIPDDYIPGESLEGILTEDCFRNTTLDFVGDNQWVMYPPTKKQKRVEIPAMRTREGTSPPGSQWTRNPFNPKDTTNKNRGTAIDQVQVPAYLEPGMYVLSFRWDCQGSSQVWNICANVAIHGTK